MSLYFTREHEWIRVEGDTATIGISNHAQEQLGDIVFAEVPDAGRHVSKGQEAAVVESVKSVSDVFAPLSGEVVEANAELSTKPELVNEDPYGKGWIAKLKIANKSELSALMGKAQYDKYLQTVKH